MGKYSALTVVFLALHLFGAVEVFPAVGPPPRLLWPIPPDNPQMELLGIFSSKADFPKTPWESFLEDVTGSYAEDRLKSSEAVVVARDGSVLVAEKKARNIRIFDFRDRTTRFLFTGPLPILDEPVDIAFSRLGHLYVVDRSKQLVLVFDQALQPLRAIGGEGSLSRPEKIALDDANGRIFVSDSDRDLVLVFSMEGPLLSEIGGFGREPGQLHRPHGLALSQSGELYVADTGNGRIARFDAGGEFLDFFPAGRQGIDSPWLLPWDLGFDPAGRLHVIDRGRLALITCNAKGDVLLATGASSMSRHKMGMARPTDLYVGEDNRLFIADDRNDRFTVWQYLTPAYLAENPLTQADLEGLTAYVEKQRKRYREEHPRKPPFTQEVIARDSTENKPPRSRLSYLNGTAVPTKMEAKLKKVPTQGGEKIHCPNCGQDFVLSAPEKNLGG